MNIKEGTVINSLEVLGDKRTTNPIVVTRENEGDRYPMIESDNGRYFVAGDIGEGGTGSVFSGIDRKFQSPVAIKISDSSISKL